MRCWDQRLGNRCNFLALFGPGHPGRVCRDYLLLYPNGLYAPLRFLMCRFSGQRMTWSVWLSGSRPGASLTFGEWATRAAAFRDGLRDTGSSRASMWVWFSIGGTGSALLSRTPARCGRRDTGVDREPRGTDQVQGAVRRGFRSSSRIRSISALRRADYLTGDLARFDGGVVHRHGRTDQQVKISDVRVELDEIGCVLRRHPDVVDSAITVDESSGRPRLVACFTARRPVDVAKLRDFLAVGLPGPRFHNV